MKLIKNNFAGMQKGAVAKLYILLLVGCFYSCVKLGEESGGEVPLWFCYSEERGERRSDTISVKGEAYLFHDSIPDRIRTKMFRELESSGSAVWIVYEGDKNATLYETPCADFGGNAYKICNFPDFAGQWETPLTGQKVYYEGKAFYLGGYACATCPTWYDLGLTLLKKK